MAKDKKWIDCPVCGASGSMVLKKNRTFESNIKDLGTLKVTKLFGYFCKECNDGIYHISSENKIEEAIRRKKAGRTKTGKLHVGTGKHLRAMEGEKPGRAALK